MNQIALPNIPPSKRPDYNDAAVMEVAADRLLPRVLDWLRRQGDDVDGNERATITRQVVSAVKRSYGDPYRATRYLEDEGWSVDGGLVDVFESLSLYDAQDKLVRAWVQEFRIDPTYNVGDVVAFLGVDGVYTVVQKRGEIVKIDAERAEYTVFCAEDGHVRSGQGTYGYVIPYEDVSSVPT